MSITPALPTTTQLGDLLVSFMFEGNSVANNVYTVSAPWTIVSDFADGSGLAHLVVAITYVTSPGNTVAPTFTNTGSSGNAMYANVFRYQNARISSPAGHSAHASSHTLTTPSASAITASQGNTLAIAMMFANNASDTWPPTGYTSDWNLGTTNSFYLAHKALVNSGDSSGSISSTSDNYWAIINLEILSNVFVGAYYANGFPAQQLAASSPVPGPNVIARGTPY
jgi:hypothetical protein